GACWGRYQSIHELVNSDPSCSPANPMFSHIEQSGVGRLLAPAIALDFSEVLRLPASGAPKLGEHTEQVVVELLGISNTEFCRLHDDGVVMNSSSH
ncbi:MAG: 2-methylfumaryl-CoA isomerase, partial [Burkholderiaceae bacterium]